MKSHFKFALVLMFSVLFVGTAFAQQKMTRKPGTEVHYKDNVEAALTAYELSQIEEAYGDRTQIDVLDHPQSLKDIKNILRNRIEIVNAGDKDLTPLPKLSSVGMFNNNVPNLGALNFNPERFNPLLYNFNFYSNRSNEIYWVDHTTYYIRIKSQFE